MGTDFYFQATTAFSLTLDTIRGEGRVTPRLLLNFVAHGSRGEPWVVLQGLSAEVWLDAELLGRGDLRQQAGMALLDRALAQVYVPITRDGIRHVDSHARGDQISLRLDLRARTTLQRDGVPDPEPGRETFAQASHLVPRASWVKDVVEPIGSDQFVLLELAIPPNPERERWTRSLGHLEAAERFYHAGNDPEVLQRCYSAFEALEGAPKAVFEREPDEEKRVQLNAVLLAVKTFMHSGRHVSRSGAASGGFAVDHRDAEFALAQAKVWLSYFARIAQKTD